jgi:hypothetical protein
MDRIEPVGPRTPPWTAPAELDPDRDAAAERRRREQERRRRERQATGGRPPEDGEPPHRVDVRA